jgi:large subunit ribosomal protein L32
MGALPKRKISKGRKNRRRAQDGLKKVSLSKCPKCGHSKRPHFECSYCGYYKKSK